MRATVYLLPVGGNHWVSIRTRGGYIDPLWATMKTSMNTGMNKCMRRI